MLRLETHRGETHGAARECDQTIGHSGLRFTAGGLFLDARDVEIDLKLCRGMPYLSGSEAAIYVYPQALPLPNQGNGIGWDMQPDGVYTRAQPGEDESRSAQRVLLESLAKRPI